MNKIINVVGMFGFVLAMVVALGFAFFIGPIILMLAWNYVMPSVFNLPELSFWQSFAMFILLSFVTGGVKVTSNKE